MPGPGYNQSGTGSMLEPISQFARSQSTLAAAGTVQANAAAITTDTTFVTGASGSNGVVLPVPNPGQEFNVVNTNASNALLVYPAVNGAINALSANASLSVAAAKTVTLRASSTTQWYSQAGA